MAKLSAEGVEEVFQLPQKTGRQHLRDLLGWDEFDEVRDLRQSISLDIHYRSLVFATEKGLSWVAVAEVGRLAGELLEETIGLPVSQAIQLLQEKLAAFRVTLPDFHLRAVCDYFHNTFIKHYGLHQFVLAQERDRCQTFASLEVYAPPKPLPLRRGTEIRAWKYQQQLAAVSAAEEEKQAEMERIRATLCKERENMLEEVYRSVRTQTATLEKETLMSLVREAIKAQVQSLHDIIQNEIQATFEILQLRLQKKALLLNPPAPYPPPYSPDGRKTSKQKKLKDLILEAQIKEKEKEEREKEKEREKEREKEKKAEKKAQKAAQKAAKDEKSKKKKK
uniref:Chromosome 8 open reading frame 74 n=1 Tax=Podarcis muralis TaxID=64176 RepID=A0A670HQK4_PODMU|nr:uncharacterized protein C8orf74 homolog [Podarcis muralis]